MSVASSPLAEEPVVDRACRKNRQSCHEPGREGMCCLLNVAEACSSFENLLLSLQLRARIPSHQDKHHLKRFQANLAQAVFKACVQSLGDTWGANFWPAVPRNTQPSIFPPWVSTACLCQQEGDGLIPSKQMFGMWSFPSTISSGRW